MSYGSEVHLGLPKPDLGGRDEFLQTVPEMRRLITRAGRRDCNLVRQCQIRAEVDGLSGEDAMTLIAYYALRMLEDNFQRELDRVMRDPIPPIVVPR